MRKTIANRLCESKNNIPHYYLTRSIKVDNVVALRKQLNAISDTKISINDFVIKVTFQFGFIALTLVLGSFVGLFEGSRSQFSLDGRQNQTVQCCRHVCRSRNSKWFDHSHCFRCSRKGNLFFSGVRLNICCVGTITNCFRHKTTRCKGSRW